MERSVIEGEEWRPVGGRVAGFPYEVSSHGRIWSVERECDARPGVKRHQPGRFIRQRIARDGYSVVNLSNSKAIVTIAVHILVADAFLIREDGHQVNHIDGIKGNNRLENLEFVTAKENIRHANGAGLRKNNGWKRGDSRPPAERHPPSVLTELDVQAMRRLHQRYRLTQKLLARMFGVGAVSVCRILNRKTWAHV